MLAICTRAVVLSVRLVSTTGPLHIRYDSRSPPDGDPRGGDARENGKNADNESFCSAITVGERRYAYRRGLRPPASNA
jgi:hypothetical protein